MRRLGLILFALLFTLGVDTAELKALMPAPTCCCGDSAGPDPCECPCPPRQCPSGQRTPLRTPTPNAVAPAQQAQAVRAPRQEARPWMGLSLSTVALPTPLQTHGRTAPPHGPPPGPRLALLCTLRN